MARPKINKLVQVGGHTEIIHHEAVIDPETGEVVTPARDEEITVPDYEARNVEMTDEEYDQYLAEQEEARLREAEEAAAWAASDEGKREAQLFYTAVMTDTLLEEV